MFLYILLDGLYVQCYARVVPGETSNGVPSSPEGFGEDAQFITKNHDYNSLQKAPVWLDREKVNFVLCNVYDEGIQKLKKKLDFHENSKENDVCPTVTQC